MRVSIRTDIQSGQEIIRLGKDKMSATHISILMTSLLVIMGSAVISNFYHRKRKAVLMDHNEARLKESAINGNMPAINSFLSRIAWTSFVGKIRYDAYTDTYFNKLRIESELDNAQQAYQKASNAVEDAKRQYREQYEKFKSLGASDGDINDKEGKQTIELLEKQLLEKKAALESRQRRLEEMNATLDKVPAKSVFVEVKLQDDSKWVNNNGNIFEDTYKAVSLLINDLKYETCFVNLCEKPIYIKNEFGETTKLPGPCVLSVGVSRESFSKALSFEKLSDKFQLFNYRYNGGKPVERVGGTVPRRMNNRLPGGLDSLMSLTPTEFERTVQFFLQRKGFQCEHVGQTGDGGIDVVARNQNPIFSGKYLVQCKRYQANNKITVEQVREFYGVIMSEGATKGLFITTSAFTSAAIDFCKDKPIELIDGNGFASLLESADKVNSENK